MAHTDAKVSSYLNEAERALAADAIQFGAVSLEAAYESADESGQEAVLATAAALVSSTDDFWPRAFEQSAKKIQQALRMMAWPQNLSAEEWLLLITTISGAFALRLFARRFGVSAPDDSFEVAFDELRTLTDEFKNDVFLAQLSHARNHGFAPFPPPLSD